MSTINTIKTSNSRKVVDIKTISKEELEKLREKYKEKINNYSKKSNDRLDIDESIIRLSIFAGCLTFIGAFGGKISHDVATIAGIIEGIGVALPTLDYFLGSFLRERKHDQNKDNKKAIEKEFDRRELEERKEKAQKALEKIKQKIETNDKSDYRDGLVALEMGTYLDEGADLKILQMPGIRKLFDMAVTPLYDGEHRVFIHDRSVRDIQPDGTFSFGTHKKLPFGCGGRDYSSYYEVRYCENWDDDHYIQVQNGNIFYYIDKEGNISSIAARVTCNNLRTSVILPLRPTREELNHLNAAMAAIRNAETDLGRDMNDSVPTIDFEGIKGASQEVYDAPENTQSSGFSK